MLDEIEKAPSVEGAFSETSKAGCSDTSEIKPPRPTPQANFLRNPRAVREAKIELLREAIHESCGFIQLHADACQTLAEAGDDSGAIYSLGRLIAYTKHAARVGNELRTIRAEAASNKEAGQ